MKYLVILPVSGMLSKEVEADSEEAAIQKAMEDPYDPNADDLHWESMRSIVRGNVFSGMLNNAEAKPIRED